MRELERFMAKVSPEPNTGCWIWMGRIGNHGYGVFDRAVDGKSQLAHRVSFELFKGRLEESALHRCDMRWCVNPDHLFEGSHADNMADMRRKGRHRPCRMPGELSSQAKLTTVQVLEMRSLYVVEGRSQHHLAALFGVSRRLVQDIVTGKAWTHV